MPEPLVTIGAIAAGVLCGGAVLVVAPGRDRVEAARWLASRRAAQPAPGVQSSALAKALDAAGALEWLASSIERAGWKESPERVAAFTFAFSASLSLLCAMSASVLSANSAVALGGLGFVSGIGLCAFVLRSAIARRRRRLAGELVPLLELFNLELSGGGSALSALGSVTMQVQGELAADLRGLLIASQAAGSRSFESRLVTYAELVEIHALDSLATILAASREYGTGVVYGVRALATDLRRAQRRELIAHSRRALNNVLIPAAVGVLLPFLAVLMFPAVTALQRSLH